MRVDYTPRALDDVAAILEQISEDDPAAARRVAARLEATVSLLADAPLIGRRRLDRGEHIRTFPARPFPYLVVYQVEEDRIVILTVWHMSRNPEDMIR